MKIQLITFLLCCISLQPICAELDVASTLNLLLPGTDAQAQASRAYAEARLTEMTAELDRLKVRKKKMSRALDMVETAVVSQFFKTYRYFSEPGELFKSGSYDQTSASMFYALLLDNLGISYSLELRGHDILLIADPAGEARPLTVKAARPIDEQALQRFRTNYIALVKQVGWLSQLAEQQEEGVIMRQFYRQDEQLTDFEQLASVLDFRRALVAYQDGAWEVALDWLRWAELAHEWPALAVLRQAIWIQLAAQDQRPSESLRYLWKLWDDQPEEPWRSAVVQRFYDDLMRLDTDNAWPLDSIYLTYQDKLADHLDARNQLKEIYYFHRARLHAGKGQTVELLNALDTLYEHNPQQTEVQELLGSILVWSLRSEREFGRGLQLVSTYERQYPFLRTNEQFQDRHLFYQAERVRHYFDEDDSERGEEYLQSFRELTQRVPRTQRYVYWLSTAHLAASDYYHRQKNHLRALNVLQEALRQAPSDPYLDHRVDVLLRYLH